MDILNQIVAHKKEETARQKELYPVKLLEQSIYFSTPVVSIKRYIARKDKSGVIAEIKRKSPSQGLINPQVSVERTSIGYMQAGASALSVLTDRRFFGGSNEDLSIARKYNFCPILRKDFIIDEYQIIEAKSIGADAILLIAAALDPKKLRMLCAFAQSLQLEVILEVHNESELMSNLDAQPDLIGVNNRNLNTFEVDVNVSKRLASKIPASIAGISESGIDSPALILELRQYGYSGFLLGQTFMQTGHPDKAASNFIRELYRLENKIKITQDATGH